MQLYASSFEDWIEHVFSHEVRLHGNAWFFDTDAPWIDPPKGEEVAYVTRLFNDPEQALATFSDAQIAQGLTYLMDTMAGAERGWFYDRAIAADVRAAFLQSNVVLFEKLFAPRCEDKLGHLSEHSEQPLNGRCYMWWDTFPSIALADDPDRVRLSAAVVTALAQILEIDSVACQESALHGLGHWAAESPSEVEQVVDPYLARGRAKRSELVTYAQAARCGCVL